MKKKKGSLIAAILSLSMLTVLAGAAIAPALGKIGENFKGVDPIFIKMILTLPALFIFITNLFFAKIALKFTNKSLSILALVIYIIGGCLGGLANNIYLLLVSRAVLGISVGILMPMSTSLISYYFGKHEQEKLMGYASAMNQLGGVLVLFLSGVLVSFSWRYSFLVYLVGAGSLVLTWLFMPHEKMQRIEDGSDIYDSVEAEMAGSAAKEEKAEKETKDYKGKSVNGKKGISRFWIYYLAMGFVMLTFYFFPTNFSVVVEAEKSFSPLMVGLLMALPTFAGFLVGMSYMRLKSLLGGGIKFLSAAGFVSGFGLLYLVNGFWLTLLAVTLVGVGIGVAIPMLNAEVSKRSRVSEITASLGALSAGLNLGQFISPMLSGVITKLFHMKEVRAAYLQALVFAVLLIVVFLKMEIGHNKKGVDS